MATCITNGCSWRMKQDSSFWPLCVVLYISLPITLVLGLLYWLWQRLAPLVSRFKCQQVAGSLLLSLGLIYSVLLLNAEHHYAKAFKQFPPSDSELMIARKLAPFVRTFNEGPARNGNFYELERIVRTEPRAVDLAAVLTSGELK